MDDPGEPPSSISAWAAAAGASIWSWAAAGGVWAATGASIWSWGGAGGVEAGDAGKSRSSAVGVRGLGQGGR
eukprot:5012461-Amphidinium_carterae.2